MKMIKSSKSDNNSNKMHAHKDNSADCISEKNIIYINYNIKLPSFSQTLSTKATKKIDKFYLFLQSVCLKYIEFSLLQSAKKHYSFCEKTAAEFIPFQFNLECNITYHDDKILSVYYDIVEKSTCESIIRLSDTWNVKNGTIIKQLIPQKHIKNIIRSFDSKTFRRFFDKNNFYLTTEGIVLYYQPNTVHPISNKISTFKIDKLA